MVKFNFLFCARAVVSSSLSLVWFLNTEFYLQTLFQTVFIFPTAQAEQEKENIKKPVNKPGHPTQNRKTTKPADRNVRHNPRKPQPARRTEARGARAVVVKVACATSHNVTSLEVESL